MSKRDDYKKFPGGLPMTGTAIDPDSLGYVYIVGFQEPGIVKIGSTNYMGSRLAGLQNGNPFELYVRAAVSIYDVHPTVVEFEAHRRAKDSDAHIRGEWFTLDVDEALDCVIAAAQSKRTRYGAWAAAHREQEKRHRESVGANEVARVAALRAKLGMD